VVVGLGVGENFVASDVAALLPVTRRFMSGRRRPSADSPSPVHQGLARTATRPDRPVRESRALGLTPVGEGPVTATSCSRK